MRLTAVAAPHDVTDDRCHDGAGQLTADVRLKYCSHTSITQHALPLWTLIDYNTSVVYYDGRRVRFLNE